MQSKLLKRPMLKCPVKPSAGAKLKTVRAAEASAAPTDFVTAHDVDYQDIRRQLASVACLVTDV